MSELFNKALHIVNKDIKDYDNPITEDIAKVFLKGVKKKIKENQEKLQKEYDEGYKQGMAFKFDLSDMPSPYVDNSPYTINKDSSSFTYGSIYKKKDNNKDKKQNNIVNLNYTGYIIGLSSNGLTTYKKIMKNPDDETLYTSSWEDDDFIENVKNKVDKQGIIEHYKSLGYSVLLRSQKDEPMPTLELGDIIRLFNGDELIVVEGTDGYNTLFIKGELEMDIYTLDLAEGVADINEILNYYSDMPYEIIKREKGDDTDV